MASIYNDPGYYQKKIPRVLAEVTANKLGITTDQLFAAYAKAGNPYVLSTVPSQGPGTQQGFAGGMGEQKQYLNTTGIIPYIAGSGGQGAAAASPTAAPQKSYLGSDPTISTGSGGAGTGGNGGGSGNDTTGGGGSGMANLNSGVYEFTGDQMMGNGDQTLYRINLANGTTQRIVNGQVQSTITNSQYPEWQRTVQSAIGSGVARSVPELAATEQLKDIDPATEALRQGLSQSYLTPLSQAGTPSAQQFQTYLDIYRQVDPTTAAARAKLGSDLAAQEALGTQLDAATQRELEQATRRAQIARGNVYGTPQLVQEAMTRGQAGLALQQQRQQALQSYLSSGQTMGDVAMNLYNQQQQQLRANQAAALSYLGSGSTPYQAGASYLNMAEQRAANAAQGGPQYNPASLGATYSGGGAGTFPQYGLDIGQQAQNWYNSLAAYSGGSGAPQKNRGMGAAAGALGGAASGALMGAAAGGVGAIPGAIIGGIGGAASGYFSAPDRY